MPQLPLKDLGPCQVEWNGVSIGRTFGGTKFKYAQLAVPVKEDQMGETPVDQVTTGAAMEVETLCSRSTLAQLDALIHNSTLVTTTLTVKNSVGQDLYADSQQLILKPWENGAVSVTASQFVTIFKAYPKVDAEVVYDNAGQRVFKVIWLCFPDMSSGANFGKLYKIG